ncbi:MAG: hypothetical protein K1X89_30580 [Myxococcaceae bacterium]|nr:hypothetical protein [Myxococcaceae bacterium]
MSRIDAAAAETAARRLAEAQEREAAQRREAARRQLVGRVAAQLAAGLSKGTPTAPHRPGDRFDFDPRLGTRPIELRNFTVFTPVENDALAITSAADPAQGAKRLAEVLEKHPEAEYRKALLADPSVQDALARWGKAAAAPKGDGRPAPAALQALVASLTAAAQSVGPDGAKVLADAFARDLPDGSLGDDAPKSLDELTRKNVDDSLTEVLRRSAKAGQGTLFGISLSDALRDAGKTKAADAARKATVDGLHDVRTDFESARKEAAKLSGQLQSLVKDLAASGATKEELKQVVARFRKDHAAEFERYAQTAGRLARSLDGAAQVLRDHPDEKLDAGPLEPGFFSPTHQLVLEAQAALRDLPDVLATPEGGRVASQALVAQSEGRPSLLDLVPRVAEGIHDEKDRERYLDAVSTGLVQTAASVAAQARQGGKPELATSVLDGLTRNARTFRVDANTLAKIVTNLKDPGYTQLTTFKGTYAKLAALTEGLPKQFALAVRGAGAALGTVGILASAGDISEASLNQQLQFALTVTGTSIQAADVAGQALGILAKGSSFAEFAGKAVPGLSIAVAGLSAFDEFSHGDFAGGAADTAIAAGTALLFAPPPADLAGGVLIVAGTLFKVVRGFFTSDDEHDGGAEKDTRKALELLGVPADKAKRIKDLENGRHYIGQFLSAEAKRHGLTPRECLDWLVSLDDGQLQKVMSAARHLHHDKQGRFEDGGDQGKVTFETYVGGPRTVAEAEALLRKEGVTLPGT